MGATPVVPIEELPPKPPGEDQEKQRLKAALASAEADNRRLTQEMRRPAPTPPPPPSDPDKMKVEFFKDPVNHSITIARMAAAEAVAQSNAGSYDTLVTTARAAARNSGSDIDTALWDQYVSEIDTMMATTTPDGSPYRTNSTVWKNAYFQVIGKHAREIAQRPEAGGNGEAPAVHIPGDGPRTPSTKRPPAPKGPALNDDQKAFCKLWGITEEAFIHGQQLKAGEGDGTPGTPSTWDEAVTVDSKKQKRFLKPFDPDRKWPHNSRR